MRLASLGMFLGVAISLALSEIIASLLFGTSQWDAAAYLGMALALLLVAVVAGYLPRDGRLGWTL